MFTGCLKGNSNAVHDTASMKAIPYVLQGENKYWKATYQIDNSSQEEKESFQTILNKIRDEKGEDSDVYRDTLKAMPTYTATFYLTYRGDIKDLKKMKCYQITFAPKTEWEKGAKMKQDNRLEGFTESLQGELPLWQNSYADDASLTGAIPPIQESFTLKINTPGFQEASGSISMDFHQLQ